jgi:hypothetical protein
LKPVGIQVAEHAITALLPLDQYLKSPQPSLLYNERNQYPKSFIMKFKKKKKKKKNHSQKSKRSLNLSHEKDGLDGNSKQNNKLQKII